MLDYNLFKELQKNYEKSENSFKTSISKVGYKSKIQFYRPITDLLFNFHRFQN